MLNNNYGHHGRDCNKLLEVQKEEHGEKVDPSGIYWKNFLLAVGSLTGVPGRERLLPVVQGRF